MFMYPLHTIIKTNIAYTQIYMEKCKKIFAVLQKYFRLWLEKSLSTLSIFIVQ